MNWFTFNARPNPNKKIVALNIDGSGAGLFRCDGQGEILDCDSGEVCSWADLEESYWYWGYVPDDYQLWYEIKAEEAMT